MTCKSTLWPLLRIPGSSLIGRGYLTINKLVTRRECIERCLFERSFKCRSVSFQISIRNNMARMGFTNILNNLILGRCILSRDDKNTEPDSFRVAQVNDEYIENQCHVVTNGAEEQFLDDVCAYEHYPESALVYAEHEYIGLNDRECQEKCFKEKFFFCKGLTYQKMDRIDNSRCYIHSEDVISMGPRAVISMRNSYYMKRVQCLNCKCRLLFSSLIEVITDFCFFFLQ
jgi:PAN domain